MEQPNGRYGCPRVAALPNIVVTLPSTTPKTQQTIPYEDAAVCSLLQLPASLVLIPVAVKTGFGLIAVI